MCQPGCHVCSAAASGGSPPPLPPAADRPAPLPVPSRPSFSAYPPRCIMPLQTSGPATPSEPQLPGPPQQVRLDGGVTPIARLTQEEEARAVRELTGSSPDVVLVASDLHLGYGQDPLTGTYPLTENFLQGGAFARWLAKHAPERMGASLLLLNGDIFDFLRID